MLKKGDRIRLLSMPEDPDPIPVGAIGTVLDVEQVGAGEYRWYQVSVEWDSGRRLMLSVPPDLVAQET